MVGPRQIIIILPRPPSVGQTSPLICRADGRLEPGPLNCKDNCSGMQDPADQLAERVQGRESSGSLPGMALASPWPT